MGGLLSQFFGANKGRTDDPDPATGLTSRDVYLIQTSWEPLRKDSTKTGALVLKTFFEKHPDALQLFPFREIPLNELNSNKKFLAHCNSVLYALSAVVDNLKEPELLVAILAKTGTNHKKISGVTAKSFWDLKEVMMGIFNSVFDKETVTAWDKALNVAIKVIVQEM